MTTTKQRASTTIAAYLTYCAVFGEDRTDNVLSDILADLMHWADTEEICFDSHLDAARMYYNRERKE